MKEIVLDEKFIKGIAESDSTEFNEGVQEKVYNLIELSIEGLSAIVPFVSVDNVALQPINETFNGAFTPMSKFIYFLGINSPQMEMNCLNKGVNFKKLKQNFIQAWHDTKRRKSKRRKKKEEEERHKYTEFEPEKYDLDSFRKDLQLEMVKNLSTSTIIYNSYDRIIIQGKEDFGSVSQIEIVPVIYDGETYKYFLSKKKGFLSINMNERLLNFNMKYEMAGENFFVMLKIFNNLYRNFTKESVNQIFLESLLYNIPNELYKANDIYVVFKNIINFLNMTNVADFVSIENKSEKIFKSKKTGNSAALFVKFMKKI